MPITKEMLENDWTDILKIAAKVDKDIANLINLKEITYLDDADYEDFLALARSYHRQISDVRKSNEEMIALIGAIETTKSDERKKSYLEDIRAKIRSLGQKADWVTFQSACTDLIARIQKNPKYEKAKAANLANLIGGLLGSFGAGAAITLLVLHCIPVVNVVLGTMEICLAAVTSIVLGVSAFVNFYFYQRNTKILMGHVKQLVAIVERYKKHSEDVDEPLSTVLAMGVVHPDDLNVADLKNLCERLRTALAN